MAKDCYFNKIGVIVNYLIHPFLSQLSKPKFVILSVLQFSETVRTVPEGIPFGAFTLTSSVSSTSLPSTAIRCWMIS